MLACILGSSAAFIDGTIVNVALPAIRASVHGGLATQEWVVDAYLLTLGSLLLVGGSLGDVFGRKRIFTLGVGGFGIASLVCAIAPDAAALIAARAVQGVTAALLVPSNLALIIDTFSERQRAAAIGSWTAWTGVATVAGPLLGGLLVQAGSWRWVFVVNPPLVMVTLWLARRIPDRPPTDGGHVDWVGATLCALGLAGPIYALIEQPTYGWDDPRVFAALAGGLPAAGRLHRLGAQTRPRRCSPSRSSATRTSASATSRPSALRIAGVTTFSWSCSCSRSAATPRSRQAFALLPISILMFLLARRFGALADRLRATHVHGIGPIIASVGLLLLSNAGASPSYMLDVFPGVTLLGLGLAVTVAPLTATVLSAAPAAHTGIASGVNNAVARVAALVAIAAVGAVIAAQFASQVHAKLDRPAATGAVQQAGGSGAYDRTVMRAAGATLQTHPPAGFTPSQRRHARRVLEHASVDAYQLAMVLGALLAFGSGILSLVGIEPLRPRESVRPAEP